MLSDENLEPTFVRQRVWFLVGNLKGALEGRLFIIYLFLFFILFILLLGTWLVFYNNGDK